MSTVSGKITDLNGEPQTGATVYISDVSGSVINPPTASTADDNGNYTLSTSTGNYITAEIVGLDKQTKQVGNSNNIDFQLKQSADANLDEVTVSTDRYVPPTDSDTSNPSSQNSKPIGLVILGSLALILIVGGIIIEVKNRKK